MEPTKRLPNTGAKIVDYIEIEARVKHAIRNSYPIPRWVLFVYTLTEENLDVRVKQSRSTFSKYVFVRTGGNKRWLKIRFSDHAPNQEQVERGDSDLYVCRVKSGGSVKVFDTQSALNQVGQCLLGRNLEIKEISNVTKPH